MVSKKYRNTLNIYLRFIDKVPGLDYSDSSALSMYRYESLGDRSLLRPENGFLYAKRIMDITICMWKEDIRNGLLLVQELIDDNYPRKFLNKVLNLTL